jgi:hypothetical protein
MRKQIGVTDIDREQQTNMVLHIFWPRRLLAQRWIVMKRNPMQLFLDMKAHTTGVRLRLGSRITKAVIETVFHHQCTGSMNASDHCAILANVIAQDYHMAQGSFK